jgi:hypothetical protein
LTKDEESQRLNTGNKPSQFLTDFEYIIKETIKSLNNNYLQLKRTHFLWELDGQGNLPPSIAEALSSHDTRFNKISSFLNVGKELSLTVTGKIKRICWKKWNNFSAIQHQITMIRTYFSTKPWIRTKLAMIRERLPIVPEHLTNHEFRHHSIVYYIYSPDTRLDYVGESGQYATRRRTELNAMRTWNLCNNNKIFRTLNKRDAYIQRLAKKAGNFGYFRFISIPMIDLGVYHKKDKSMMKQTKTDRLTCEKHMIRWLTPSMNMKRLAYRKNLQKYVIHHGSWRTQTKNPMIYERKSKKPCICGKNNISACSKLCFGLGTQENRKDNLTMWRAHGLSDRGKKFVDIQNPSLTNVLDHFNNGDKVEISRMGRHNDATDSHYLMRAYRHSKIYEPRDPSDTRTGKTPYLRLRSCLSLFKHKELLHLQMKINNTADDLSGKVSIEKLATQPNKWASLLKKTTRKQVVNLWAQSLCIPQWDLRVKTIHALKLKLSYWLKKIKPKRPTMTFTFSPEISKRKVLSWSASVIEALPIEDVLKTSLLELLGVTMKNGLNLKQLLTNVESKLDTLCFKQGFEEPPCTCAHLKTRHPDWIEWDKEKKTQPNPDHFQSRLACFPGLEGQIGKLNASVIPESTKNAATDNLLRGAINYLRDLANLLHTRKDTKQEDVSSARKDKRKGDFMYRTPEKDSKKSKSSVIWALLCELKINKDNKRQLLDTLMEDHSVDTTSPNKVDYTKRISLDDVYQIKENLEGLVIQILDKNKNQIYVECPVITHRRLQEEVVISDCFKRSTLSEKSILDSYRLFYDELNLKRFAPYYGQGRVSKLTFSPKHKDPVKKARIISDQSKSPWRNILRLAAKAINFMITTVTKVLKQQFNLNILSQLREKLRKASEGLKKNCKKLPDLGVFPLDVKQMFTFLNKKSIITSMKWMIKTIRDSEALQNSRRKRNKIQVSRKPHPDSNGKLKHFVGWHHSSAREEYAIFSFDDLIMLMNLDLDHSHFTMGNSIWVQVEGCPIGGFLSTGLALTKCIHDEFRYLTSLGNSSQRIRGIRQVDDLLLMIQYNANKRWTVDWVLKVLKDFGINANFNTKAKKFIINMDSPCEQKVYTGGLELEYEKPAQTEKSWLVKYAGTDICIGKKVEDGVTLAPHFRNWDQVKLSQTQDVPRLPPTSSHTSRQILKGSVHGLLHSFRTISSDEDILERSVMKLYTECSIPSMGYPMSFFTSSLRNLSSKSPHTWRPIYNRFVDKQKREAYIHDLTHTNDDERDYSDHRPHKGPFRKLF